MDWARDGADWPLAQFSQFITHKPHRWHVQIVGTGQTLLMIHGAGGGTQSWRHLTPLLAKTHRVISVDLPGQGFTKLGAKSRCGLDAMAQDLHALMIDQKWNPSAIIGHSAGAAIALRMAEDMTPAPPIIGINAALSNFSGLAGIFFPMIAKTLSALPWVADFFTASTTRAGSVERLIAGTGSNLSSDDLTFYRRMITDRAHVDATLAMMAQWSLDPLLARLPQHLSDTLLITGANDKAVPPETSRKVAAQMQNAKHHPLEGLGHLAHEEDAATIAALIHKFLGA